MKGIHTVVEIKKDARVNLNSSKDEDGKVWSIRHDELWKRVRKHMKLTDRLNVRKAISAALIYVQMGQDMIDGNNENIPVDPDNWEFVFK